MLCYTYILLLASALNEISKFICSCVPIIGGGKGGAMGLHAAPPDFKGAP